MVLVHGFGASAYHWRYTVPELAKSHRVFAVDLLGFGWSDKPLGEYSKYQVWPEQLAAFMREVCGSSGPCMHAHHPPSNALQHCIVLHCLLLAILLHPSIK